jgi:hypothetical protein
VVGRAVQPRVSHSKAAAAERWRRFMSYKQASGAAIGKVSPWQRRRRTSCGSWLTFPASVHCSPALPLSKSAPASKRGWGLPFAFAAPARPSKRRHIAGRGASVSVACSRDVETARLLDGFSRRTCSKVRRVLVAGLPSFPNIVDTSPALSRGTKGTERVLLLQFREVVRALQWRAPPLRSSHMIRCNLQA